MNEKKTYKNRVVFLHKSKKRKHLYAFNENNALGENVESLIMNISEVKELIAGEESSIKISIKEKGGALLSDSVAKPPRATRETKDTPEV